MRHNIVRTGPAFRLRPIVDEDASLVIELRGGQGSEGHLHPVSQRLEDQLSWLSSYYGRPGDYYFVIERKDTGTAEGLISLYDIDPDAFCGEWGRWIIRPGSLAAIESSWLIYSCAFEDLQLREVFCRTVAKNLSVLSFHDSCGIPSRRFLPRHFEINGKIMDAVEHRMLRSDWHKIGLRMKSLSLSVARRLRSA